MNLQTALNWLLTGYASIALPVAILASIAVLFLPFLYMLARGQSIQRTTKGGGIRRKARLLALLLGVVVPLAVVSWVSIAGRQVVLNRSGQLDERLSVRLFVLMGVATIILWFCIWRITRSGSWLSEFLNLLTGGVRRRRDELGSAHFTDMLEYKRFATRQPDGVTLLGEFRGEEYKPHQYRILGQTFSLSAEDASRGIITIGNPGSGKTQSIILPVIADSMRASECLIVTDPQGELKHPIMDFARVTGHIVMIHDPTDPESPRYNLVDGLTTISNARALAEVLIPVSSNTDFWAGSARALLAGCMIRYGSIGQIVEKLGRLEELLHDLKSVEDDARFLVSDFIEAAEHAPKQAAGVTATVMRALDAWADSTVRGSTGESDFKAIHLVKTKRPVIVLLSCPGRDRRALAPYLGAVLTRLLLDLDTLGERIPGGALPRPLKFVLEEFPALGNLQVIVEQANLVRKRRISFLLACQTVGQLYNIYGKDGTATLLAGMATQIVFGGADKETAAYFSALAGNQTRVLETDGQTKQKRTVERPLLTHDQIISPPHAPQGNVIIFTRYVTATYAVNAVILARLTRMYERHDWLQALSKRKGKLRLFSRIHANKQAPGDISTGDTKEAPAIIPNSSVNAPQFLYRRVIDDSTPPDQQNIVIPFSMGKQR